MKPIDLRKDSDVLALVKKTAFLKSKDSITFKPNSVLIKNFNKEDQVYSIKYGFTKKSWTVFVSELDNALKKCPFPKKINLQFNSFKLSLEQMNELKVLFKHMKIFYLKNIGIDSESLQILADHLQSDGCEIRTVHLENNILSVDDYNILCRGLQGNTSIYSLILDHTHDFKNHYYDQAYKNLSKVLCTTNIKGVSLVEKSTPLMCVDHFAMSMNQNKNLNKIAFGWSVYANDYTGKTISHLADAISKQGKLFNLENVEKIKFASGAKKENKEAIVKLNNALNGNKKTTEYAKKSNLNSKTILSCNVNYKNTKIHRFYKPKKTKNTIIIPHEFFCPIARTVMINPVIARDQETYESDYIKNWLSNNNTSPVTREVISKHTTSNRSVKKLIDDFMQKNKKILMKQPETKEACKDYFDGLSDNSASMSNLLRSYN